MTKKLDNIAKNYTESEGFEKVITRYKTKEILSFTKGKYILDVGCGNGMVIRELVKKHDFVIGLDGSKLKLDRARKNLKGHKFQLIHGYAESYMPDRQFDTVILSNVLEHVAEPVSLLVKIHKWLNPTGKVIATVPNADSLPRTIGLISGFIKNKKQLTVQDEAKGHLRVYDKFSLEKVFKDCGFKVDYTGGIFFKPLPHRYMMRIKDRKLLDALYGLRKELSRLCSSLIIVAEKVKS